MVKSIGGISEELHEELVREAGNLQQAEGKYISLAELIERMLKHWRRK